MCHVGGARRVAYLLDQTHAGSQPSQIQILNWLAVELDLSRAWVVPSLKKADNCTFTGTASTLVQC